MLSPFSGNGTARFWLLRALLAALGDGAKQIAAVGVSGAPAPGACAAEGAGLFAHAFSVQATGARVLLLGNWCDSASELVYFDVGGTAGARVIMVNATHGTDTTPAAEFVLASGEALSLGPLAVAVSTLAAT